MSPNCSLRRSGKATGTDVPYATKYHTAHGAHLGMIDVARNMVCAASVSECDRPLLPSEPAGDFLQPHRVRIKILQLRLTLCLNPSLAVDRKRTVDDGMLDRGLAVLAQAGFCGSMAFPAAMHDATSRCIAAGPRIDRRQTIKHSFHSIL